MELKQMVNSYYTKFYEKEVKAHQKMRNNNSISRYGRAEYKVLSSRQKLDKTTIHKSTY